MGACAVLEVCCCACTSAAHCTVPLSSTSCSHSEGCVLGAAAAARYLMGEFFKDPVSCLTLASYLITNTGARRACVGLGCGRPLLG